jgi:hypothetical protein
MLVQKIRPERTMENAPTDSSVLSGRTIFPARIQPLRSWLISAVPAGHKFSRVQKFIRSNRPFSDTASIFPCGFRVRSNPFVFTTSLTCFFSPRRGQTAARFPSDEKLSGQSRRPTFPRRGERFSFSPGEKAGMRAVVQTILVLKHRNQDFIPSTRRFADTASIFPCGFRVRAQP